MTPSYTKSPLYQMPFALLPRRWNHLHMAPSTAQAAPVAWVPRADRSIIHDHS